MTPAEREQAEALVTAYAMGALDPAEAARAQALLDDSPELQRVFEEAIDAAALLAAVVSDVEPPPGLRDRILEAVRREQTDTG
ncbi:MAG: hypothetical protein FJW96_00110 [Actinobacteria bacterium]|nr:hypothetical protein [Actinomycetota bacterium]